MGEQTLASWVGSHISSLHLHLLTSASAQGLIIKKLSPLCNPLHPLSPSPPQGTALLKGGKATDLETGSGSKDKDTSCASSTDALVASRLVSPLRYFVCNTITLLGNIILIPLSYSLISMPMLSVVLVALYEGSGMLVAPAVVVGFAVNFMVNIAWLALLRR